MLRRLAIILVSAGVLVGAALVGFVDSPASGVESELQSWQADMDAGTEAYSSHQYSRAQKSFEKALSELPETESESDASADTLWKERSRNYNDLGLVFDSLKQHTKARKLYKKAITLRQAHGKEGKELSISTLNNLSSSYAEEGDSDMAAKYLIEANDLIVECRGADHPSLSVNLNRLAGLYKKESRYGKAAEVLRKSLEVAKKAFKTGDAAITVIQNNLAAVLRQLGNQTEAQSLYEESLKIREEALGEDDLRVAAGLNNLARSYREQGLYDKAEPLLKRSLEIARKAPDTKPEELVAALKNLGLLYRELGESERALPLYEEAIKVQRSRIGEQDISLVDTELDLAAAYQELERYDDAKKLLSDALEICDKDKTDSGSLRLRVLAQIEDVYGQVDDFENAIAVNDEERKHLEGETEVDKDLLSRKYNDLALLNKRSGDSKSAETNFKKGLHLVEEEHGADSIEAALILNNLARLYASEGEYEKAAGIYKNLIEIRGAAYGARSLPVAAAMQNYAAMMRKLKKTAEASKYSDEADKIETESESVSGESGK
ncbi:MAG: tetratricopeptide repeat protein [Candidatus Obscuribacterales bacterium]|nr:tetratricopeptide repeat protein [Candidatus Obscuribacterales bacterium]